MNQNDKLFADVINQFIGKYEYDYDLENLSFLFQAHPILQNCVGVKDKKFVMIDSEEHYNYFRNEIIENIIKILITKEPRKDKLRTILFLFINKPFHIPLLIYLKPYLTKDEFSSILKDIWIDTEFPHQNGKGVLLTIFQYANREQLMNVEEKKAFKELSDPIIVYRGLQKNAIKNGLSWTTDKKVAQWFANRFNMKGNVLTSKIYKKDVFAYKLDRNESEIILNPDCLEWVK